MNIFKTGMLAGAILSAMAAHAAEPAITLRTSNYDTAGPSNTCTIVVGGTPDTYIEVDCGFGPVEYEIKEATFDYETQTVTGTTVSCQVSSEGLIKIYTDEDCTIDYINAEGCGLEWVEFADPSAIRVVNFSHNELKRLDLSDFKALEMAYVTDNPFSESPLVIGKDHPMLSLLEINAVYNLDPDFDIDTYPELLIFDAFAVPDIRKLTPAGCPKLVRLSLDCTNVAELNLSNNPELLILNISETAIKEIDLSGCPKLEQLYAVHQSSTYNPTVKLSHLDTSMLPHLQYLFASGNDLADIDVSGNPELNHLWLGYNKLTEIDLSQNLDIASLRLEYNYFNFITLPEERDTFNEYEYAQNPLAVPAELEAGKELDLSAYTARPGTTTVARLVSFKREAPYTALEVSEANYSFTDDGKLTVNVALADSVRLELANSAFPATALVTQKFMVKKAADMGKPDVKMTFQPATEAGRTYMMRVGIEGASEATPKTLIVTQGDGTTAEFPITVSAMPDGPNVYVNACGYGSTTLSVNTGDRISAIDIEGVEMYACDVTPMTSLRELSIKGAGLYSLDLSYNRCLEKLVVNGNHLSRLNLDGVSGDFTKNMLRYVDLSGNELTELTNSWNGMIVHFDLSNNRLAEYNFTGGDRIEYLNVSHNEFTELKINYLGRLKELDASFNKLVSYIGPEATEDVPVIALAKADFSNNCLTYATLPARGNIAPANFVYAPQAKIEISAKAPGCDLSSQAVTIDGAPVEFAWVKSDGTPLVAGTDYTITDGRTRFLTPAVGSRVSCMMTCAALPAFSGDNALSTTEMEVAAMPTNVVAEFRTLEDATVELSLAASADGTDVYIDWNGDGSDLVQYSLTTTYRQFEATARAGKDVKVYTYNPEDQLTVFSMGGVKLGSFDGSQLTELATLTLINAGLSAIEMPAANKLIELTLQGNEFTEFDASKYPGLRMLSLTENKLTELDLTACPDLLVVAAGSNRLSDIRFHDDCGVFFLDLTNNQLESFNLQQLKYINQIGLANNKLESIDPSGLADLRVIALDYNRFTFATLPLPEEQWTRYTYSNQADLTPEVDGLSVDLSSQKEVAGTATLYRWFVGTPVIDAETGELNGEELVADEEYTVTDGVTTFVDSYGKLTCVMTNEQLPQLMLYTVPLSPEAGLEDAFVDGSDTAPVYYTLQGIRVSEPERGGVYIVVRGNSVGKELLK